MVQSSFLTMGQQAHLPAQHNADKASGVSSVARRQPWPFLTLRSDPPASIPTAAQAHADSKSFIS